MNKDIYEYLTNFADDRTILNMLSVNKKFNDDTFFKRVLFRKYPLLLKFKTEETYKNLFLRMTYYIAKLEEEFEIPYIPLEDYNPEIFYKGNKNSKFIYDNVMYKAAKIGRKDIIDTAIKKGARDFNDGMLGAAVGGHLDIVKFMLSQDGRFDLQIGVNYAALYGHMDIVKFFLTQENNYDYDVIMDRAAKGGHMNIVKLMIQKGATDFNWALIAAASEGYIDIVKLMIQKGATDFNWALNDAEKGGHKDIIELLKQKSK